MFHGSSHGFYPKRKRIAVVTPAIQFRDAEGIGKVRLRCSAMAELLTRVTGHVGDLRECA